MSDIAARLHAMTKSPGRDHRSHEEFVHGFSSQAVVDILREAEDKIEGLEADLESAVETAFKRGATEWTRLNYPDLYARFNTTS